MVKLIDEAQGAIAQAAARGLAQRAGQDLVDEHASRVGRIEQAQHMQQRALAGTRGTDDRNHFARLDCQVDINQHIDTGSAVVVMPGDPLGAQD